MRQVILLRAVNLGPRNRIAMPALRSALADAGYEDVRTHLQSGNVVLSSAAAPDRLASDCRRLIAASFGLSIAVITRTRDELAEVVRRNPLAEVASDPRRYQVSFLATEPDPELVRELASHIARSERLVAIGRELYAWHPEGVARSKLWSRLAGPGLGVPATARNWKTVTALLAILDE